MKYQKVRKKICVHYESRARQFCFHEIHTRKVESSYSQFFKMASIDNTIEAPTIATDLVTNPTAPTSGLGAGADEGLRSCAEATTAKTTTKKENSFIVADDAILKKDEN